MPLLRHSLLALVLLGLLVPGALTQDVTVVDTLPTPPADTIVPPPDDPGYVNLHPLPTPVPPGWETGVWEWDREGLQATRALSLLDLLHEIPGVIALRGGDIGNPAIVHAPGLGPGRIRVFSDGAELAPLDGGVPDLARIGLTGLERVRVERRPGEIRIDLLGLQVADPRPWTLVEVGTGDLQTNLFRGTFVHPTALGGSLIVALDRLDTEGPRRNEPGASFGGMARQTFEVGELGAVAVELRRMTSRRPEELYAPVDVTRTDLNVRARRLFESGILADLFYHRSSLGTNEERSGEGADTLITAQARGQIGARLVLDRGDWWGETEARLHRGDGWPTSALALRGGGLLDGLGGASAELSLQRWDGRSGTSLHGRVWSAPLLGVSLYAEAQGGERALPLFVRNRPPEPDPDDDPDDPGEEDDPPGEDDAEERFPPGFSTMDGLRAGAEFRRGALHLGAAFLSVNPDSLRPMDLPFDRGGEVLAGGRRSGVEFTASLPLDRVLDGLTLAGETQFWQERPEWSYAPTRTWQAGFRYHNVFFETRNLEVWTDIGVRGRDGMAVPLRAGPGEAEPLLEVPFFQSWHARLQIRVVSMRIFVDWENFAVREDNLDFPERRLPQTRAVYGIRWTLWN